MTIHLKTALWAGIALAAAPQLAQAKRAPAVAVAAAAPAAATTAAGGPIVPGLGVANVEAVVANSNAYRVAQQQRQTTYKSTYDAAEARRKQIAAQLQPMVDKLKRDSQAANAAANQAALQQQYGQIQQIQESANQELQRMLQPVALSEAYVNEQINDKLGAAIQAAMNKNRISVVLAPTSVIAAAGGYNLNQAILTELNAALPSAQIVPPAGWEPREVREARAAQGQGGAAAAPGAPARPAGPQPDGR